MDKQFEHRNYHWPQPPLECAPATLSQSQQNLLPQQQHQLLPYEPAQGTSHFVPPQHMYHYMSNQQSQPFSAPQQQPSYAVNRSESRIDNHQPASKEAEIQKFVQEQENMRAYMRRILDRNKNLGNENLELQNTNQLLQDTTVSKDVFDKVAEEAVQKSKQLDDLKERLQQEKNKGFIKDLNNSQLKDKLDSAENNLKTLSENEKVLEKENEELRNIVANFKAKESNHEREVKKFKKDQKGLMQDWKDYDVDKKKLEEDQKAMEEREKTQEENDKILEEKQKAMRERERKLESDRNEFNIQVEKYETDKRQLDAARELEFNTEMQKLEEERKNLANQKDTHSEKVKKDKQILTDEKFKHMKNVNELRTARQKLDEKENGVGTERKELVKNANGINAERKDFAEKIVQLETDKHNIANDVNDLHDEKQTLLQQVEKLEAETQGLKSNVEDLQHKLQSETETTELLKGQVQELTQKTAEWEMANNALKKENERTVSENQEEINTLMEQLREITPENYWNLLTEGNIRIKALRRIINSLKDEFRTVEYKTTQKDITIAELLRKKHEAQDLIATLELQVTSLNAKVVKLGKESEIRLSEFRMETQKRQREAAYEKQHDDHHVVPRNDGDEPAKKKIRTDKGPVSGAPNTTAGKPTEANMHSTFEEDETVELQ